MRFVEPLIAVCCVLTIASCDVVDTVKEGFTHSQEVADDLKKGVGLETQVGFNQNNGVLTQVTVTFAGIPEQQSLPDIAAQAKAAVKARFEQEPQMVIIAFALKPGG